jgi:flagellar hook assembly protein FlgD
MNILKNDFQNQGKYTVRWNGKNMKGQIVTSGIYFYKMSANGLTLVKKMLLLK